MLIQNSVILFVKMLLKGFFGLHLCVPTDLFATGSVPCLTIPNCHLYFRLGVLRQMMLETQKKLKEAQEKMQQVQDYYRLCWGLARLARCSPGN